MLVYILASLAIFAMGAVTAIIGSEPTVCAGIGTVSWLALTVSYLVENRE